MTQDVYLGRRASTAGNLGALEAWNLGLPPASETEEGAANDGHSFPHSSLDGLIAPCRGVDSRSFGGPRGDRPHNPRRSGPFTSVPRDRDRSGSREAVGAWVGRGHLKFVRVSRGQSVATIGTRIDLLIRSLNGVLSGTAIRQLAGRPPSGPVAVRTAVKPGLVIPLSISARRGPSALRSAAEKCSGSIVHRGNVAEWCEREQGYAHLECIGHGVRAVAVRGERQQRDLWGSVGRADEALECRLAYLVTVERHEGESLLRRDVHATWTPGRRDRRTRITPLPHPFPRIDARGVQITDLVHGPRVPPRAGGRPGLGWAVALGDCPQVFICSLRRGVD